MHIVPSLSVTSASHQKINLRLLEDISANLLRHKQSFTIEMQARKQIHLCVLRF